MGRFLSTSNQLQISLFFLVCCWTCLNGASLTVEQRLQALEATNVEIKEILIAKNQRIEALETEVQELKSIVIELQNEKTVIKNDVTTVNNQPTGKNAIFRTCRETHLADPSLPSGLQWIDPDGQGVGDDPIQVFCDMATGMTSVLHGVAVNGMASSCNDLWRMGHTLSGFYFVKGIKMIESVYCDFALLGDAGFEKRMGFLDVKSSPTFFYVQKSTSFSQLNIPIPFEVERVNVGGAMNLSSGKFTAPRPGVYFFTFSGLVQTTSTGRSYLKSCLVWNGNDVGATHSDSIDGRPYDYEMTPLQSTLELKAGDTVWLRISHIGNANLYNDNYYYHTHFTGQLLQEDISQSFL